MTYYSVLLIITCMICAVMIIQVHSNPGLQGTTKKIFIAQFALLPIAAISEWLGVFWDGAPEVFRIPHIIAKTVDLSIAPFAIILWAASLNRTKRLKWYLGGAILNMLLQIVSAFTGFIFYFDVNNVYRHGDFYFIYTAICLIFLLIQGYEFICFSRNYQYRHLVPLVAIAVFALGGVSFHQIFPEIRVDWLCAAISFSFSYALYESLVYQRDGLTKLLNRRSYETLISELKKPALILVFDVDNFKSINDTYGHDVGDTVLKNTAGAILSTFGKHGQCYRTGGDEFCVVIQKKPLPDVEVLLAAFRKNAEAVPGKAPETSVPDVTVGYALFTPGKETVGDAVKKADMHMYQNKQSKEKYTD